MEKFSDRYLNFYDGRKSPRGAAFLWPVWVWEVFAPDAGRTQLNLFQRSILGLFHAKQTDPVQIAEWLGIESDMVLYIIAGQLQPNGWMDAKGNLTEEGVRLLEHDQDIRRDMTISYVFQDAFSGKLWPRVTSSLPHVDATSVSDQGHPEFQTNRETGWIEKTICFKP